MKVISKLIKKIIVSNKSPTKIDDKNIILKFLNSNERKDIMKELDKMIRESLIVRFPHSDKRRVFLNPRKRKEFEELIAKRMEK